MRSGIIDVLRRRIIDGSLSAGTHVSEEWVSREMGVSRGPVREALRELENEGLIIVQPYRGAVVSEIAFEELKEILLPVRLVLETQACLRLLPDLTERELAHLEVIVEEMRDAVKSGGRETLITLVDLDVSFHAYLIDLAGQYHSQQLWRSIQSRVRVAFYRLGSGHQDLREIPQEHQDLIDALRTRDPEVIKAELEIHICTSILDLINKVSTKSS